MVRGFELKRVQGQVDDPLAGFVHVKFVVFDKVISVGKVILVKTFSVNKIDPWFMLKVQKVYALFMKDPLVMFNYQQSAGVVMTMEGPFVSKS